MLQTKLVAFVCWILIEYSFSYRFFPRNSNSIDDLRYSVILSPPLDSSLDWDYYENDENTLIFRWTVTLLTGYSGILAFSNHDLDTDQLDVIVFGDDLKLYNGYTDEDSYLYLPEKNMKLDYRIIKAENLERGKKKRFTIEIIRPLDTCDEQKRNYIIDHGTTHLLTGTMARDDFQKFKQRKTIEVNEERMSLTLQRVQLLKSQVKTKLNFSF